MKNNEIIKRFEDQLFAEKTCLQLIREFDRIGISIPLDPKERDKDQIIKQLATELGLIMEQAPQLLSQLFYAVDLPEEQIEKIFTKGEDVASEIAELLLIRAAQKVYIREKFSS